MEQLLQESPIALQAQVAALARGTNPVVYFPVCTTELPEIPENAEAVIVVSDKEGSGVYYYLPEHANVELIRQSVSDGNWWKLLGFVQSKEEASKGVPGLVVARDEKGNEIKSAVVNVSDITAMLKQRLILRMQFPKASITIENLQGVVLERLKWAGVSFKY